MAPTNQQGGTALATRQSIDLVPQGTISDPGKLAMQLADMRERAHVLSPIVRVSSFAPGYSANLSVVQIDSTVDEYKGSGHEVYNSSAFMRKNERAFNRIGLRKIAAAVGIEWLPAPFSCRTDNGRERFYWSYTVEGRYRAPDGTILPVRGSAEVDLRDGSAQIGGWTKADWDEGLRNFNPKNKDDKFTINGWTEKRVLQKRSKGLENAETLAMNRAIRDLGLKHVYTVEELRKPFVCVRFAYVGDPTDPESRRLIAEHALTPMALLYGNAHGMASTPMAPAPGGESAIDEPEEGAHIANAGTTHDAPKEATFDDDDEPEADDRPRHGITHVLERNANGDWPVQLTDGTTLLTNDKSIARAASEAGKAGKAVVLESAQGRIEELTVLDEPAPAAAAATSGPCDGGGDDDAPADDGQRYVKKVKEAVRTGKNDRGSWTLSFIVLSTGEEVSTFSSTDVAKAKEAEAKGWPVRVQIDDSDPERPRLSSIELIDPRQGSLLNEGKEAKY